MDQVPDPQVPERPRPPRQYPAAYKLRILAEYERLGKAGKGALAVGGVPLEAVDRQARVAVVVGALAGKMQGERDDVIGPQQPQTWMPSARRASAISSDPSVLVAPGTSTLTATLCCRSSSARENDMLHIADLVAS